MDWKRGNITAIFLWHLWRYSLVFHIYVAIMAFLAMPQISGILGIYGTYGKYGIVPQNPGFTNNNKFKRCRDGKIPQLSDKRLETIFKNDK